MYQLSHRRLDKKEVAKITIGNYIDGLKQHRGSTKYHCHCSLYHHCIGLHNENKRNQFQEKLNCVRKAWAFVKERLKDHGNLPNFSFGPWTIVYGGQKIESAQKIHASRG